MDLQRDDKGRFLYTTRDIPQQLLDVLVKAPTAVLRIARSGVPHVIIEEKSAAEGATVKVLYSIAWFAKNEVYRIFFPWPGEEQTRVDFRSMEALLVFLTERNLA